MTYDDHPVLIEPTLEALLGFLEGTEMVYIHGMDDMVTAILIPVEGWWKEQLPEAPPDHFDHAHVRVDGRMP